jgi:hypothetical protein
MGFLMACAARGHSLRCSANPIVPPVSSEAPPEAAFLTKIARLAGPEGHI